jgi:cytidine deaminase
MIAASSSPPDRRIAALCIVAEAVDGRLTPPCGGCRQRIAEFAGLEVEIHVADPDGKARAFRLGELFPEPFALGGRR